MHTPTPSSVQSPAGPRQRALDDQEKQARREAILDAADRLFAQHCTLANVADIAQLVGLAKGTVYLYFQSKEEIYLALHLRHCASFFEPLIARLQAREPFAFEEMAALACRHILDAPGYLPLGACCSGFAANAISPAAMQAFQVSMGAWLQAAGTGLERHFPRMPAGEGTRLLNHSYAIMVGLYSLMRAQRSAAAPCPLLQGMGNFQQEALLALTRYWTQVAGPDATAGAAPSISTGPTPP